MINASNTMNLFGYFFYEYSCSGKENKKTKLIDLLYKIPSGGKSVK